jgi:hypothetical protein
LGRVFAGTANRGIFRSAQAERFPPLVFGLEQNYPNPFFSASTTKPITTIEFTLSNPSAATLKVYDMLGAEVTTLMRSELPAGRHTVQWNAEGMPNGVYFYRLQAGGSVQTKKLVVVK